MGTLKNIFGFEKSKLGNMWGKVKKQPERLLIGGENPLSAKVAEAVTGKKYEPLVDEWGGATEDDYAKAEAEGINTRDGRAMHGIAQAIAGMYAGKWANGRFGGEGSNMPSSLPDFGGDSGGGQRQALTMPAPIRQDPYNPYTDPAVQSLQAQQQRRAVADALLAQAQGAGYTKIGAF